MLELGKLISAWGVLHLGCSEVELASLVLRLLISLESLLLELLRSCLVLHKRIVRHHFAKLPNYIHKRCTEVFCWATTFNVCTNAASQWIDIMKMCSSTLLTHILRTKIPRRKSTNIQSPLKTVHGPAKQTKTTEHSNALSALECIIPSGLIIQGYEQNGRTNPGRSGIDSRMFLIAQ